MEVAETVVQICFLVISQTTIYQEGDYLYTRLDLLGMKTINNLERIFTFL